MDRKERYRQVIGYFQENMPVAETELVYSNAYQLAVAVILSAQCTDKRVNQITPWFFRKFPTPDILAKANSGEIYELIKSCSYPNNKAKNLQGMARVLVEKFKGEMPDEINKLQELPGIGRKSANVILSVIYSKPVMAVDTHVFRVSKRIGLTWRAKTPLEAEKQLVKYISGDILHVAHHWLILHGRYICTARAPKCNECGMRKFCRYFNNVKSKKV
ncbi:MAG: endonuclease III [Bacteroidales bacterium]